MKIVQLQYFCAVTRLHSITKAAAELYVTQPAISSAIKELEKEFSINLFNRTKNHLTLTKEGELFYQKAVVLLEQYNNTLEQLYDLGQCKATVKIGIPPLLSTIFFPQLITDFNLTIKQGQKVAIVGPTGCGKTTMINLLLRYYDPVSGGIYIDDVNTLDIKKNSLRKAYGLVLQDTWIFRGTVRENIAYAKPEATLEEVIEAAKLAHAHSFIKRLPNGYDTVISATSGLSQGEKQLITIARLMMTVPDVVILDEATSSIDTLTEQKIVEAFNYIMDGRTSFVIAHRLSTIQGADLIIVMNKGNIVEVGNHQELIKKNGFYTKLYNQGIVDN